MTECKYCGREIAFVQRWWPHPTAGYKSVWVVVDPEPFQTIPQHIEIAPGEFLECYRHVCDEAPLFEPEEDYRDARYFGRGPALKKQRFIPKKNKKDKKQTEMKF